MWLWPDCMAFCVLGKWDWPCWWALPPLRSSHAWPQTTWHLEHICSKHHSYFFPQSCECSTFCVVHLLYVRWAADCLQDRKRSWYYLSKVWFKKLKRSFSHRTSVTKKGGRKKNRKKFPDLLAAKICTWGFSNRHVSCMSAQQCLIWEGCRRSRGGEMTVAWHLGGKIGLISRVLRKSPGKDG